MHKGEGFGIHAPLIGHVELPNGALDSLDGSRARKESLFGSHLSSPPRRRERVHGNAALSFPARTRWGADRRQAADQTPLGPQGSCIGETATSPRPTDFLPNERASLLPLRDPCSNLPRGCVARAAIEPSSQPGNPSDGSPRDPRAFYSKLPDSADSYARVVSSALVQPLQSIDPRSAGNPWPNPIAFPAQLI